MTRRLPVEIAVLWACLSAGISAAQIVSASADLSQRIGGQVYIFGQSNFDATSSLGNDLRRGPDPYFRPSTPEIYIAAASEQDVVQGVKYALDNDAKLSLRGQGVQILGPATVRSGKSRRIDMLSAAPSSCKSGRSLTDDRPSPVWHLSAAWGCDY